MQISRKPHYVGSDEAHLKTDLVLGDHFNSLHRVEDVFCKMVKYLEECGKGAKSVPEGRNRSYKGMLELYREDIPRAEVQNFVN